MDVIAFTSSELYHHGIKGQEWGKRNGPPYPLENKHSLKQYTSPARETVKSTVSGLGNSLLAAVIPGYGLAANATTVKRWATSTLDHRDYTKKEGDTEKLSEMKKKTSETSTEDDLKKVNPRLGQQAGKINNCVNCSMAMEMRARGYDVQARSTGQGWTMKDMLNGFKTSVQKVTFSEREKGESRKDYVNRCYDNLCNTIEKNGNGSRGVVTLIYEGQSSGHAMYWTVNNGSVQFYDGQSGTTKVCDKAFSLANQSSYSYARLDNANVNSDEIGNYVVSVKDKK